MVVTEAQLREATARIWSTMLSLPLNPRASGEGLPSVDMLTGRVRVSGAWTGAVSISCATSFARKAAATMFEADAAAITTDELRDGLGELVNVLGGNLKALLAFPAQLSLPTVLTGGDDELSITGSTLVHAVWFDCEGETIIASVVEHRSGDTVAPSGLP